MIVRKLKKLINILMTFFILLSAVLAVPISVSAINYWDQYGLWAYTKIDNNTHIRIDGLYDAKTTDIVIPSSIDNLPVTVLGEYNNSLVKQDYKIKSAVIPNGVKTINYGAFSGQGELSQVVIPDSVSIIDGYAFDMCIKLSDVSVNGVKNIAPAQGFVVRFYVKTHSGRIYYANYNTNYTGCVTNFNDLSTTVS